MSRQRAAQIRFRRRLELLLPVLLLILCAFFIAHPLQELLQETGNSATQLRIEEGEFQYLVRANSECIGTFSYTLAQGRLLGLVANASMRVSEGGVEKSFELTARSFYNPLQQLVQAVVQLSYDGREVKLLTENVHPINVDLSVSAGGEQYARSLKVPGPILLEPTENSKWYTLQYPRMQAIVPSVASDGSAQLLKGLQLSLERVAPGTECETKGRLEIDALSAMLRMMTPTLLQQDFFKTGSYGK